MLQVTLLKYQKNWSNATWEKKVNWQQTNRTKTSDKFIKCMGEITLQIMAQTVQYKVTK